MYKLYTNQTIISTTLQSNKLNQKIVKIEKFFLENFITIILHVPQIIDPSKWLIKPFTCILNYKLKTEGEKESLEMFIHSPVKNGKYYVIGDGVLISTSDLNETFDVTVDTINMLLQRSMYCHVPYIEQVTLNCTFKDCD